MPEDNPTTATSEGTSTASDDVGGGSADGGAGGTDAAEKLAAERDALQAEARRHQAERDRVAAENARLKAELAKGTSSGETPASGSGLTAEQIAEQVRTAMRQEATRSRELALAAETARKEYPNALGSIFQNPEEFDSAEELLETARASHQTLSSFIEERTKAAEKELRDRYEAVHGPLPEPASADGPAPSGDPTVEQLSSMSIAQLDALELKEPGIIDRIIRSADGLAADHEQRMARG